MPGVILSKLPAEMPGVTVETTEHYTRLSLYIPRVLDDHLEQKLVARTRQSLEMFAESLRPALIVLEVMNRVILQGRENAKPAQTREQERAAEEVPTTQAA